MGDADLHIFVDMKVPRVHVSMRGTTKAAEAYLKSTAEREMKLRHIRVDAETSEIKLAQQNGEVVK